MGQIYSASFSAVAVTANQDLFELVAPANNRVVIREIIIGQYSDPGDAQAELLPILLMRGHTVTGSGGTTPAANGVDIIGTTFGGTIAANNTTPASGGSPATLRAEAMNVMGGFRYYPVEEERIKIENSQRFVVRLNGSPADSLTMNGTIIFETIGNAN